MDDKRDEQGHNTAEVALDSEGESLQDGVEGHGHGEGQRLEQGGLRLGGHGVVGRLLHHHTKPVAD